MYDEINISSDLLKYLMVLKYLIGDILSSYLYIYIYYIYLLSTSGIQGML